MSFAPLSFTAHTESGRGRGKDLGVPTLNLVLADVHPDLEDGIYACFAMINGRRMRAAMHLGPRPVFKDSKTCEIHLLDASLPSPPPAVTIDVVGRLREVHDFPSTEALQRQMQKDINDARAMLDAHA